MPSTLTIANTSYNGSYELTNNTSYGPPGTPLVGANVTFAEADSLTLAGDGITAIAFNTGNLNDTLRINTGMTGSSVLNRTVVGLGSGDDSLIVNNGTANYSFQASTGNDTILVNAASSNTVFAGNIGADLLVIGANMVGGQVSAGVANDGTDTIIIASGVTGSSTAIQGFQASADFLLIGTNTISSADWTAAGASTAAGTYTSIVNTGNNADIAALNDWLANGGNSITLI